MKPGASCTLASLTIIRTVWQRADYRDDARADWSAGDADHRRGGRPPAIPPDTELHIHQDASPRVLTLLLAGVTVAEVTKRRDTHRSGNAAARHRTGARRTEELTGPVNDPTTWSCRSSRRADDRPTRRTRELHHTRRAR
jgi:hypothetical protein